LEILIPDPGRSGSFKGEYKQGGESGKKTGYVFGKKR
jgi:hypothetical protein